VRTEEDARRYIRAGPLDSYERLGFGLYLVALKATGEPIGICGLLKRDWLEDVDVGFAFLEPFRSQGFGFESAQAVLAYGRSALGLERILAIVSPDNEASICLLQKLGFRPSGSRRPSPGEPEVRVFVWDV
jgi:RimJ/RimL family protein N-acetyltransferase